MYEYLNHKNRIQNLKSICKGRILNQFIIIVDKGRKFGEWQIYVN